MARVPYVGVGNKARKVKKMYIGVDDKAHKVLKGYVGVNGIAHIFFTADWWVPYGLQESNCIAAWQFYHAASQSAANADLTGHGHTIYDTRYGTWTAANGYYISEFISSNSVGDPVTGVFWYTGLTTPAMGGTSRGKYMFAHGSARSVHMAGKIGQINRFVNGEWTNTQYPDKAVLSMSLANNRLTGYRGNSDTPVSGVIAFDRSKPQIYINGNAIGVTHFDLAAESVNNFPPIQHGILGGGAGGLYIRSAAFFNCGLSARQHSDIAKAITEVK